MLKINPAESESNSLHLRSDLHLLRKTWHIFTGLSGLNLHFQSNLAPQFTANVLFTVAVLGFLVDISRMYSEQLNHIVMRTMGPFMRESEKKSFSGFPFYALGVALSLTLYQEKLAILAILFLIFSDPISAVFGVIFGKDKILPNKSLQGATAGFVTCYFLALFYGLLYLRPSFDLLSFSLFAGFVGMVSELASGKIDDNLTIPLISGGGLTLLNLFVPLY